MVRDQCFGRPVDLWTPVDNHKQHQLNIGVFLKRTWYNIVFIYVYELV
jgi:hypothetical protein